MSPSASFVSTRVDPYGRGQEFGEAQAVPMAATVAAYAQLFERLAPVGRDVFQVFQQIRLRVAHD